MEHFRVFDDKLIHSFDFKEKYVGYVVDNKSFEEDLRIKVFIPELFGYLYNPAIKNLDSKINISTGHLIGNGLNITTELNKQEYIWSRPLIERGYGTANKSEFLKKYKPEVGDKILVSFFNKNPNNCIYENVLFVTNGETITLDDGTEFNTRPESNESINKRSKKVTWQY